MTSEDQYDMQKIDAESPEARSADLVAQNIEKLKALFPELITEDENGVVINVDVLKDLVGDNTVTNADEKYGLNWHGKRRARQLALMPSTGTLRPCPEDSVDWDATQNLMIEGDNLEVLKLLQKSYAGKVKLIYIDPPYNTGKDFVYPDDYRDDIRNYLELTGQIEGEKKISSNAEAGGRFHTNWLNMIYPRLRLGVSLLAPDGLIAVSIDDSELPRLIVVMDEILGEENVMNVVVLKTSETSGVKMSHVDKRLPKIKEYLVIAARDRERIRLSPVEIPKSDASVTDLESYLRYYSKMIENPTAAPHEWNIISVKEGMRLEGITVTDESEREFKLANADRVIYRTNNDTLEKMSYPTDIAEVISPTGLRYIWWQGKQMLFLKDHLVETLCDLWTDISTINLNKEAGNIQGFRKGQKPLALLSRLLTMTTSSTSESLILDFFAGSGTTGHAVIAQNAADRGNRRYILVQLPEPLDPDNSEQKTAAEFCDKLGKPRTIAELTKERLRRAAKKIKEEHPQWQGDTGFRVFKLDTSNIRVWNSKPADLESQLFAHQDHIVEGRTEADILYELLLKLGLDLCVPIERRAISGKDLYSVGGGVLLACLAPQITYEDVEPLAQGIVAWHKELAPAGDTTCIFRDSAFADDVAKTNLTAILQQHGIQNVRSL
jgi:adenine-specific DNA-methyltransferase